MLAESKIGAEKAVTTSLWSSLLRRSTGIAVFYSFSTRLSIESHIRLSLVSVSTDPEITFMTAPQRQEDYAATNTSAPNPRPKGIPMIGTSLRARRKTKIAKDIKIDNHQPAFAYRQILSTTIKFPHDL